MSKFLSCAARKSASGFCGAQWHEFVSDDFLFWMGEGNNKSNGNSNGNGKSSSNDNDKSKGNNRSLRPSGFTPAFGRAKPLRGGLMETRG